MKLKVNWLSQKVKVWKFPGKNCPSGSWRRRLNISCGFHFPVSEAKPSLSSRCWTIIGSEGDYVTRWGHFLSAEVVECKQLAKPINGWHWSGGPDSSCRAPLTLTLALALGTTNICFYISLCQPGPGLTAHSHPAYCVLCRNPWLFIIFHFIRNQKFILVTGFYCSYITSK